MRTSKQLTESLNLLLAKKKKHLRNVLTKTIAFFDSSYSPKSHRAGRRQHDYPSTRRASVFLNSSPVRSPVKGGKTQCVLQMSLMNQATGPIHLLPCKKKTTPGYFLPDPVGIGRKRPDVVSITSVSSLRIRAWLLMQPNRSSIILP